jgi:hypothetical protein
MFLSKLMLEEGAVMLNVQNENIMDSMPFFIIHVVICEPHMSVLRTAPCIRNVGEPIILKGANFSRKVL